MSGIINSAGSRSGIINSYNRTLLPAFKQGWGSSTMSASGILSSSLVVSGGGNMVVQNDRDVFNNGGHWDVSTGKFTVPVAGIYMLGILGMRDATAGTTFDMRVIKNATSGDSPNMYARAYQAYSSSHESHGMTTIVSAVAGDYFTFWVGSTVSLYNDDSYTFGTLIS
jgi:hypothetical protein